MAKLKFDFVALERSGKVDRNDRSGITRGMRRRTFLIRMAGLFVAGVLLFLVIQGVVSIFVSILKRPETGANGGTETESAKVSLTLLLFKEPDDRSDIEYLTLVRLDPQNGRATLTPIPAELVIDGKDLHQYYHTAGGEAGCALAVQKLLDADKIYYSAVNNYRLSRLLNKFGGVTLDWRYIVIYQDPDDKKRSPSYPDQWIRSITVSPEKRTFSGSEVIRLLNWPEWPGGLDSKRDFYAQMWCNFINEQLVYKNIGKLPDFYLLIYRNSVTELSQDQFQNALAGLESLCEINQNGNIASVVLIPPTVADGQLVYDEDALENLRALYGD